MKNNSAYYKKTFKTDSEVCTCHRAEYRLLFTVFNHGDDGP